MIKMKLLILFLIGFNNASYSKFSCKDYKMDYISDNKTQRTTIRGCFKKSSNPRFVSEDCQNTKCSIIRKIKDRKWENPMPYPLQGSPHFMACYKLKGTPGIVNITADKRRKFSLCRFQESFIDAYTLMFHIKKKMDRQKRRI